MALVYLNHGTLGDAFENRPDINLIWKLFGQCPKELLASINLRGRGGTQEGLQESLHVTCTVCIRIRSEGNN